MVSALAVGLVMLVWSGAAMAQNAYISNQGSNSVSVINTATNAVVATVGVGTNPSGVAVTPDGTRAYVANTGSNSVSVINTATNAVVATVAVGNLPIAFGKFIGPVPPGPVPTLSEWAMILFGLALAGGAAVMIQRRKMMA